MRPPAELHRQAEPGGSEQDKRLSRRCGAHVWRCPSCDYAVAKAIVRKGGTCPRPQCADAEPPYESTCRTPVAGERTRCNKHGGLAPWAVTKTEERETMARTLGELGELVAEMETLPVPHPLVGLEDTYALAGRMVAAVKVLVDQLQSPLGSNRFGEDVVHPLVGLLGEWLDRYARVQKMTLDAGLDQRRAPLDGNEAEAIRSVLMEAVAAVGLTPAQQEAFEEHVSSGLRSLAAG